MITTRSDSPKPITTNRRIINSIRYYYVGPSSTHHLHRHLDHKEKASVADAEEEMNHIANGTMNDTIEVTQLLTFLPTPKPPTAD